MKLIFIALLIIVVAFLFYLKNSKKKEKTEKIKTTAGKKDDNNLKNIKEKEEKRKEYSQKYEKIDNSKSQIEKEVKTDVSQEIKDIKKVEKNKEIDDPKIKILSNYKKLSEQCKSSIQRRLFGESYEELIKIGATQQSIEDIWEYMKNEIMNGKEREDITLLKEIYNHLFEVYNEKSGNKYERMETTKGELFDTDFHIRISNKKASGEIKEIKLLGYREKESKKIIKKTVVEL